MAVRLPRRSPEDVEISMSPMIDMVFLLLIFFLVSSKPLKPEADLGMKLPGTVAQEEAIDIPDEQRIKILASGQVLLNDMPIDTPDSKELPQLLFTLTRFKQACKANRSEALVTLDPEDDVKHQRIADVMNVCAKADIDGVTFAGKTMEE
ncbi:MAG: biopolymer transporter ExbD [Methylacidiphilales bacterium]|nr:biopolymer transporter ExbD [Candidatus Methylacidiphilales bacterium]MDW8348712.1 biopolymer transporter ExbD [Verrucomicrobiae bacterium]